MEYRWTGMANHTDRNKTEVHRMRLGVRKRERRGGEMAAETQPFKAAYPAAQCLRWTHK